MDVVALAGLLVSVVYVGVVAQITASRQPRERHAVKRDLDSDGSSVGADRQMHGYPAASRSVSRSRAAGHSSASIEK